MPTNHVKAFLSDIVVWEVDVPFSAKKQLREDYEKYANKCGGGIKPTCLGETFETFSRSY